MCNEALNGGGGLDVYLGGWGGGGGGGGWAMIQKHT